MKTATYVAGLLYGAPGDTVDVSIMENSVSFTHLGTAEAARRHRDHRGQVNSWSCAVATKDIDGVNAANVGSGGGLSGLFGWMSGPKGAKARGSQAQKRLVIRALYNGRPTKITLQGAGPAIDYLAKTMIDASRATRVLKQRDRETAALWRD